MEQKKMTLWSHIGLLANNFLFQMDNLDTECVTLMAAYNQTSFQEMSSEILEVRILLYV